MQAKLHRWAGEDSSRRFGDLFNLVCDPYFLAEAWSRARGNRGARTPGIDGVTAAQVEAGEGGVSGFLEEIRGQLKAGTYRPSEVRQVMIPKKNGKLRKLGIPSVRARYERWAAVTRHILPRVIAVLATRFCPGGWSKKTAPNGSSSWPSRTRS